jgi:hypothetical protein
MGNTVSTGKLVGAFKGTHGKPVYVLYEQSYESNVYPHQPSWNAQMIGSIESVMRRIFVSSASCEGGSLLGAGGRPITPEGYIASWLQQLSNPVEMDDCIFELKVGTSWTSPIPDGEFVRIKPLLEAIGATRILAGFESESRTAMASLHADHEALCQIYDGTHIGAWRIIPSYSVPLHGKRNSELGYNPTKAKAYSVEVPRFMQVRDDTYKHLILGGDGMWRCVDGGHGYNYLSSFICNLSEAELREPGSYRTRIKAYRDAISTASVVPADAKIIVSDLATIKEWAHRDIQKIIADTPHTRRSDGVHMSIPVDHTLLYWATGLPSSHTTWVFDLAAPTEQLSLLAG